MCAETGVSGLALRLEYRGLCWARSKLWETTAGSISVSRQDTASSFPASWPAQLALLHAMEALGTSARILADTLAEFLGAQKLKGCQEGEVRKAGPQRTPSGRVHGQ